MNIDQTVRKKLKVLKATNIGSNLCIIYKNLIRIESYPATSLNHVIKSFSFDF